LISTWVSRMEGSSSSVSSKSHDNGFNAGLTIISSIDNCPAGADFDLILRAFGSACGRCDDGGNQIITLSTKRGQGLADPRDLQRLTARIDDLTCVSNSSRVCICGVEALLLWNGSQQVREFLIRIDEDFKRRGARAFLVLREDALPIEDVRMIKEILSR